VVAAVSWCGKQLCVYNDERSGARQARERLVKRRTGAAIVFVASLAAVAAGHAQQPTTPGQNPLDVVPEKMPFNTPYGAPISLQKAEDAIHAAVAEANKRGWQLNIAVVDSGGNLVAFSRMDGAQLASISIAEHKARASAKFRRPTRLFEDAVQKGIAYIATLDDIVASRGGIPLIEDGKLVGAIGCSGGTGSQDEVVCSAGAATINK
jgi:glc operon protein GlcG